MQLNSVNKNNNAFLDIMNDSSNIFKTILSSKEDVQSIYIDKGTGQITYSFKKTESRNIKKLPDFLSKYMESEGINFLLKYLEAEGDAKTDPAPQDKPQETTGSTKTQAVSSALTNINSIFNVDTQKFLKENKLEVYKIYKENGNIFLDTNAGKKSKEDIQEGVKSTQESPYDFDLSDQDVIDIEKEILRSLNLEKTAKELSKEIAFKSLPYDLKITLGGVLKESKIVNHRYKLKEYSASVNTNAKPKKFLVQFEATQISSQEGKPEENNSQENNGEQKKKVSNFNEVSDEDINKLISAIKKLFLEKIDKSHGGLIFKKEKKISQQRSGVGKVLMGEDTKDKTFAVSMVLSGGEENADYNFKKDENKITGSFSLSVSLGKSKRDRSEEIGSVVDQISNVIGTTDNSGVTL